MKNSFRYFKASPEIIRSAVMMYVRFPLSLRQVEDLLYERGVDINHETVRAWWKATLSSLSYDDILWNRVGFGSGPQIIERLEAWQDVLGIDGITVEMNAGGMLSEAQVKNSLRVITRDVMPAFK